MIAARSGISDLAGWATKEAGGYALDDELPAHRIWDLTVTGNLHNPYQGFFPNVDLGPAAIPEQFRQQATSYRCRDGVGDLETMLSVAKRQSQTFAVEHPQLAHMINAGGLVAEGWTCTQASAQFSPVHLMNIVTKARQTALTLCLECESAGVELHWLGGESDPTEQHSAWLRTLRDENTKEAIKAVWFAIRKALFPGEA